jgi:zinc and cadmium transporter
MTVPWGPVLVATAVAWGGALVAVVLRQAAGRIMRPLVYLALLVLALAAIVDILPQSKQALSWPILVSAVAVGYGAFWLIGKYVTPICPACAMRQFDEGHHHAQGTGLVLLVLVLGIHCFLDGLGVSAASTVEASFGLRVFGAIALHKLPEGFALGMMLMAGGRAPWAAFAYAVGIEAATLAGAIAGVLCIHPSEFWLATVLAHIGGTFLYLSVSGLQDALSPQMPPAAVAHP